MGKKIKIFGKHVWPYTKSAREAFELKGIEFSYLDVNDDPSNLETMLKLSDGERKVPVIVEGDKVTIGFNGKGWKV